MSGDVIADPGPAPTAPQALPADGSATPQMVQAHDSAHREMQAHGTRVQAYNAANAEAAAGRAVQTSGQSVFQRMLTDQLQKAPLTAFDGLAGAVGGHAANTSKWRGVQDGYLSRYARAQRLAASPHLPHHLRMRANDLQFSAQLRAITAADKALPNWVSRQIDRLPTGLRNAATSTPAHLIREGSTGSLARGGRAVLSKIPYVGLGIAAAGIGYDIANDKPVDKAIFGGVVSTGAAIGAGAAIAAAGGPVGWVVGGGIIAGVGVGYAADWAWDKWGDDVKGGVADAASAVGGWFKDTF